MVEPLAGLGWMINWTRIHELNDEIGSEDFAEVVELFLSEAGTVVARLRDIPDPAGLEAELHFLKGGVLNLGFEDVARLCQEGEALAAHGNALQIDLQAIVAAYDNAKASFLKEMPLRLSV